MRIIKLGSRGPTVKSIQLFLIGYGINVGCADSVFGTLLYNGVKKYQKNKNLTDNGIIGNTTLGHMLRDGLALLPDTSEVKRPEFLPLTGFEQRAKVFGRFKFEPAPTANNPEGIKILGDWESKNIVLVDLPELAKATDGKFTKMRWHKLGEPQLKSLWKDWESAGLLKLIKSYEGAFYPRYVRGSRSSLSNHSFGTAFDINYWWNKLGAVPAAVGAEGSVRALVPIAHKNGFYWGGHFSRTDGMHFEIAKIV